MEVRSLKLSSFKLSFRRGKCGSKISSNVKQIANKKKCLRPKCWHTKKSYPCFTTAIFLFSKNCIKRPILQKENKKLLQNSGNCKKLFKSKFICILS